MYRKLHLTILVIMMYLPIFGQSGKTSLAQTQYEMGAYEACIMNATEGLQHDPSNLSLMQCAARSYVQLNKLNEADHWYKQIFNFTSRKEISVPQLYLEYGHLLKRMGRLDEAVQSYHDYAAYDRETGLHFASGCGLATEILKAKPNFDIYPFVCNSEMDDYGVQITPDGYVFCSFRTDIRAEYPQANSSIVNFFAINTMEESMALSEIRPLPFNIDAPVLPVLLANGTGRNTWIISTGTFQNGVNPSHTAHANMKIFSVTIKEDERIELIEFPFNAIGYSTGFAHVSDDGKIMYFASNMPGGYGGFDLYYSIRSNDSWTTPVNLGNKINTVGNELSPFINGNELLFASDYHPGLGGFDLFRTFVANGTWSTVENLGKGVNSFLDDMYPAVTRSGEMLSFSSNRKGGKGGYDIYLAKPHIPTLESLIVYSNIPPAIKLADLQVRPSQPEITDRILTNETESKVILNLSELNKEAIPSHTDSPDVIAKGIVSNYFPLSDAQKANVSDTSPEKVFFIQLAAFTKSDGNVGSFAHLKNYGNLYKVHKSNSIKLRLGYFTNAEDAEKVLRNVRNEGYKDAFLVIEPLVTSELELVFSSSNSLIGIATSENTSAEHKARNKTSHYKIRLASYTDPLWFDTERVKDLGEIEQWTKGNYTIFILSGFADLEATQRAMNIAINRGFTDAHIVIDNNGFLEKLKEN